MININPLLLHRLQIVVFFSPQLSPSSRDSPPSDCSLFLGSQLSAFRLYFSRIFDTADCYATMQRRDFEHRFLAPNGLFFLPLREKALLFGLQYERTRFLQPSSRLVFEEPNLFFRSSRSACLVPAKTGEITPKRSPDGPCRESFFPQTLPPSAAYFANRRLRRILYLIPF